jgi:hypothetical protein
MKKVILICLLAIGVWAGSRYWPQIKSFTTFLPEVRESFQDGSFINDLRKEISAPGPLRGSLDAIQSSNLTVSGTFEWTNKSRTDNGLPALRSNETLNQAAQLKVQDMFAKQYFEHVSPDGKGPADVVNAVHYEYVAVGENLALGNFRNDEKLVEAWMNSPGHRANILSAKFTEIGIAVGKGRYEGRTVWLAVQTFAKPASDCPLVDANLKAQINSYQTEADALEVQIKSKKAELEAQDPKSKNEYDEYNAQVKDYNQLVKMYNNKIDQLKQLVAAYNSQVAAFNACVGK